MSSSGTSVFSSTSVPTPRHNYLLLAGGYFSLGFSAFQASAIGWPARAVGYFGGPAELRIEKPIQYALLCLAIAAIMAVFGLYALSGAGKIRRLPLLRTVLIAVTAIYLLRGLLIIPQAPYVLTHPGLVRFVVFSAISLVVGLVHLGGVVQLCRHGRPAGSPKPQRTPVTV
jgi:hypothetical protein